MAKSGNAGFPSTSGNKSGGGRNNNTPKQAGFPSKTGNESGKGRDNNPPKTK